MGQQEVYNFLRKNKGKKYSCKEMSKIFKVSNGSVQCSCKKLKITKEINYTIELVGRYKVNKYWI